MSTPGIPPELTRTHAIAASKVPASWGAGYPTRRGIGWHFKDPIEGRRQNVRAEPGFVHLTRDGRTLGRSGEPIDVGSGDWQIPEGATGPGLGERASELASPYLRQIVLAGLTVLADGASHSARWPDPADTSSVHEFDDMVNDLLKALDGPKGVDPYDAIGDVLLDSREAAAVAAVVELLGMVIDETGPTAPPGDVIRHPVWPEVAAAARAALAMMKAAPGDA